MPLHRSSHVHEITAGGIVMQDENVKVTAALVDHPPVVPSCYRFDSPDRSIVISGDTPSLGHPDRTRSRAPTFSSTRSTSMRAAVDRLVGGVANASRLKESIMSHHTSAEDAGRVAHDAGVKTLVLSHFVPADDADHATRCGSTRPETYFEAKS